MAVTYEYASATYGVGLDGLHVPDEEALNAVTGEGWEPVQMTSVHNGFAVLILFRREAGAVRTRASTSKTAKAAAAKAAPARKAPAKKAPARAGSGRAR